MSRRAESRTDSLVDALRDVVREITGVDDEDIDLRLEVSGFALDEVRDVHVVVEYGADAEGVASEAPEGRGDGEPAWDPDEIDEHEDETEILNEDEDLDGDEDEDEDLDGDEDEDEDVDDDEDEDEDDDTHQPGITIEQLDEEADAAADFLEGLLDAMQLPGDLQLRVHEDHAEVEITNIGSGQLIGRRGQTLDAIQELLRCAMQRQFERRCRVVIDVEGYRQRRLEKLLDKAQTAIDEVLASGQEQRLEPMDVYERKEVHRLVAEHDGVTSASRGREPTRRVVISPE
jgi:spoIIIJ-associated protein